MSLGQWLNALTLADHIVILVFVILSGLLAHFTSAGIRHFYRQIRKGNPYATKFRITPFFFLGITIIFTTITYKLLGSLVTAWITSLFEF